MSNTAKKTNANENLTSLVAGLVTCSHRSIQRAINDLGIGLGYRLYGLYGSMGIDCTLLCYQPANNNSVGRTGTSQLEENSGIIWQYCSKTTARSHMYVNDICSFDLAHAYTC